VTPLALVDEPLISPRECECTVELLTPGMEAAYSSYLANEHFVLLYATLAFRDTLIGYLGCNARYFLALNARREIVGVLPAMISTDAGLGRVLNSLPYYGSNGGVMVHDNAPHVRRALLDAFHECAEAEGCVACTIITSPYEGDCTLYEQDPRFELRDERIGLLTPLPAGSTAVESTLLSSFAEPRPRNIRRAIKAGVMVSVSDDIEDYRFLHATHEQNIRAIGGLAKDWTFFEQAMRSVPVTMRRLYVARVGGERVAALLLFYANSTVEYFTPATVEAARSDQPLSLLIFRAMVDAATAGYNMWNWGGTWLTQDGVYDFKRRWGTVERRYFYYSRVLDSSLLRRSANELLTSFPHFFVVPFSQLSTHTEPPVALP